MLENVKSRYIFVRIFEYFDLLKKLKLIRYNKKNQNKRNINLNTYKEVSNNFRGKRKIIEENGITKELDFYTEDLIYEGEYLNRKRNGKGKEYNKRGELIYEGEYLNGKRNGKGKAFGEYDDEYYGDFDSYYENEDSYIYSLLDENKNGIIRRNNYFKSIFEGEYLNGKKNGKGKEYNYQGDLIFEGEFLNGLKWNGKIKDINIMNTMNINQH